MFKQTSKLLLVALLLITFVAMSQPTKGSSHKRYAIDENGNKMVMRTIAGKPPKVLPPVTPHVPKDAKAVSYLEPVPCYDWSFGCTATATSMMAGYYDNFGADNVYIGPENGGIQPISNSVWNSQANATGTSMVPVAASCIGVDGRSTNGHNEDYWVAPDSEVDPYYGAWTEHDWTVGQQCTADWMGTNQFHSWENIDGSTALWNYMAPSGGKLYDKADELNPPSRDGNHGFKLFYESCGYDVTLNYNQLVDGWIDPDDTAAGPVVGGYTFEDYMAAIDAGRPVLIGLDNHSVVGYGYDDSTTPGTVYIRSTWYNNQYAPGSETFPWGTDWNGMYHYAMSEIILSPKSYFSAPDDLFGLNDNQVVTLTWSDPSEGTKNLSYDVYRDDVFLVNVSTPGYVDNTASDGVHGYKVKGLYSDPDPDIESFFSNEAIVFVSISVTEFHDDFEPGGLYPDDQWILYDDWGLDTEYFNTTEGGSTSLADSPGALYPNGTDAYPAGGSVGEIAPGLNFSTAADVEMDFYFKYEIEMGFDYMHLQTCKDGINWTTLKIWDGYGVGWYQEVISLGVFAGESNVRLRFLLITDGGLEEIGANIDDMNIMPSTDDLSPPFVFYNKDRDYYDNNPDGFTIITDITDYTGINYARVDYTVNSVPQTAITPTGVVGDEYVFEIPAQNVGDYVEFQFDCEDTAPTNNQGYTGPFFYQAGKHLKSDNGWTSYIVSISSTPADTPEDYVEAIAVKFSLFHDDIAGVVIRGYTDVGQDPNANVLVDIFTDVDGLPGASILSSGPIPFVNPATITDTGAWAYCDLSSISELDDLDGIYHVVISSDTNESGYTITNYTECNEDQMYAYGNTSWKYVHEGESVAIWEHQATLNQHTRVVTTDYGYTPGLIDPNPNSLAKSIAIDGTSSDVLAVNNIGDYSLDYTASYEYVSWPGMKAQKADVIVESNDFESGLVYTNAGTWSVVSGQASTTTQGISTLTSTVFDGSVATDLFLDFDQANVIKTGGYFQVEWSDGSTWTQVYNGTATTTASQHIAIPNTAVQVRFIANVTRAQGQTGWQTLDNVSIYGPIAVTFDWLSLDGGSTTSGTVAVASSDNIAIGYDAIDLTIGEYTAIISLNSLYSNENVFVSLDVTGGSPDPDVPANVVTSISGTDLVIDWDVSANATGYDVYSSDDPYGTFTFVESVTTEQYTVAADQAKLFYYIIATNAAKTAPKVTIKKSATR